MVMWLGILVPVLSMAQSNVTVSTPDTTIVVGQTLWVPVVATDLDSGYTAYQITVKYPKDTLKVVGVEVLKLALSLKGIEVPMDGLVRQLGGFGSHSPTVNWNRDSAAADNVLTPGTLVIVGAGVYKMSGSGPLFYVGFEVLPVKNGSMVAVTPGPQPSPPNNTLYAFSEVRELPTFISGTLTIDNPNDTTVSVTKDVRIEPFEVSVAPNPFNSRLVITAPADERAATEIVLWSALGQQVRTWTLDPGSGVRRIVWDGTSSGGHSAGSGIYLVDVCQVERRATVPVTLAR